MEILDLDTEYKRSKEKKSEAKEENIKFSTLTLESYEINFNKIVL